MSWVNEGQIERFAEREMDNLDALLLKGSISQDQYDQEVRDLDRWVTEQIGELAMGGR